MREDDGYATSAAAAYAAQAIAQHQGCANPIAPEQRIATMVREDLGVTVNPQALRMFIRTRWARLSKAAHEVHDGR
jgi:hypothetical protein